MADQFYIQVGVRRAVAAREAGLQEIPAIIFQRGLAPIRTRLFLDQLHSPKPVVARDSRYIIWTEYPTVHLKTEPPPIEVEPLGIPGQTKSIPLAQVRLI